MHQYPYPRPMVTTDVVVLRKNLGTPEILLIQRANDPFAGSWAFPGGFVDENEDLEAAAHRELEEETGLADLTMFQFQAVGTPGRDPRGHTISVIFVATCPIEDSEVTAADDAVQAAWFPLDNLPDLAFDHSDILARMRLDDTEEYDDESE